MFEQVIFMVYHTNCLMGTEIPSLWIKQLGHEDDHSSPCSAIGKNESVTPTLRVRLHCTQRAPLLSTSHTFRQ